MQGDSHPLQKGARETLVMQEVKEKLKNFSLLAKNLQKMDIISRSFTNITSFITNWYLISNKTKFWTDKLKIWNDDELKLELKHKIETFFQRHHDNDYYIDFSISERNRWNDDGTESIIEKSLDMSIVEKSLLQ